MGIQVVTINHYLGGFIGDRYAEERWLADKITGWAESVETLTRVSRKHPYSAQMPTPAGVTSAVLHMQSTGAYGKPW